MINFSTEFPINQKNTVEDVLHLASVWLTGSPHTNIPKDALEQIPPDQETSYTYGYEKVIVAHIKQADFEMGGLRYIRTEQRGLEWTTSIVTWKTTDEHLLSIQVACEALNTAVRLPAPKKPYFIRQALAKLSGGIDGEIPVRDRPYLLKEDHVKLASALMMGIMKNRLPIVYVSTDFKGEHIINPDKLARLLSGMAHVVIEPSRAFSFQVKTITNAKNVYGGTIGVYWPQSNARTAYFLDDETLDSKALQSKITNDIRIALSNRRPQTYCTWNHLRETLSRKRLDILKAQGSTELSQYIAAFDAEQAAKDKQLSEAEQEIARLNAEIGKYSSLAQSREGGLIKAGKEQDLYKDEISEIIIQALQKALRDSRPNSRRQHILTDLLNANPSTNIMKEIEDVIKSTFRAYKDMDARTRMALAKLGFDIAEDGKHYKAIFQGDSRYTFILPKTSSDHRAGKNLASDINNLLL